LLVEPSGATLPFVYASSKELRVVLTVASHARGQQKKSALDQLWQWISSRCRT